MVHGVVVDDHFCNRRRRHRGASGSEACRDCVCSVVCIALQLQAVFPRERQETVWIGERVRRFMDAVGKLR